MHFDEVPPNDEAAGTDSSAGNSSPRGARSRSRKRNNPVAAANYDVLLRHFTKIYGVKSAWDGLNRRIVPIDALRQDWTSDAVKFWLEDPNHKRVFPENLMFEPGQDLGPDCIQLFNGLELEAEPASEEDVRPMLDLLDHLCSESAPTPEGRAAIRDWILCWMALPLQQLGAKMATAIVMHGPQGTGKNLFWDAWRDLYGVYGVTVGQTQLEDKFNEWLSAKLAIIGDEVVSRQEVYHNKNVIKLIVTQMAKFPIRAMQQPTRWESNHANVVFLSNEMQPLALEERDRRYLVVYVPLAKNNRLYEAAAAFLARSGLRKWLGFLQSYDIGSFQTTTKPLHTTAKSDLIQIGWRSPERFANDWLAGYLPLPLRVCSSEQLYRAYAKWCQVMGERQQVSQHMFSSIAKRWLHESAAAQASGRRIDFEQVSIRAPGGAFRTIRLWMPDGCGCPPDQSKADWVPQCLTSFEDELHKFNRAITGGKDDDLG